MTSSPSPAHAPSLFAGPRASVGWLLLSLSMLLLVAHSLCFNFVTDDAFISFVYSRNLAQHGQLVFNLGERVEGYTNFLWTLIIAGGLRIGVPAELSSRVLGTLCGALGLVVAAWLFACLRQVRDADAPLPHDPATDAVGSLWACVPALTLALIPGYACWSSGGLETQLFALLLTGGCALYVVAGLPSPSVQPADRRLYLRAAGLCLGLSALTRPEGYLFFALLGAHLLLTRVVSKASSPRYLLDAAELQAVALFLALTLPHIAFRRLYYGDWVPNTFYVKSSGGSAAWGQGAYYLFAFCRDLKLIVLPVLYVAGLAVRWPTDRARAYARIGGVTYLLSTVFLLYVASVGGDFMGLYRFVLPIVPLNVVCGALGLYRLLAGRPRAVVAPVLLVGAALHIANTIAIDRWALTFIDADRGIDTPGYLAHYARDRAAIGRWLGQHVAPDDYQVVGGAGAQVYYAGIRALDSFGLCDAYVARKTPPRSTRPGHQKFAPLDYVLSRQPPPTILTYNVYRISGAPYRPSPGEAAEWRARGFHFVSVQIPGLSQPWYSFLKRIDRRLGPLPAATEENGDP